MSEFASVLAVVIFGLIYLIFIGVIAKILLVYLIPTKSKSYRKYLTNLYVAGRIRQLAEQDKIDLEKEDLECLKYVETSMKQRIKELDDKIEAELIKKVEKKE